MEEFKIVLQKITAKDPEELTETDIIFLKARASYLSEEEKKKFAEILGSKESSEKIEGEIEEIKPKKRGRPSKKSR